MTRGGWTMAFFLTIAGGLCVAQSEPQSVADVAKKIRSEKKAAVTLSDDNFVRRTPVDSKTSVPLADTRASAGEQQSASAASSANASPNTAKGEAKSGKAADDLKKDDLKKEELKKQLDSYKADRDGWNKSAKRYEDLLANEPDQFRRQMYQDALDNDRRNVSLYQKKIDESAAKMGTDSGADAAKTDQATSGGNKP
jgi:1,2-phenylacetyl-CoA epoxidase PaaB subunit